MATKTELAQATDLLVERSKTLGEAMHRQLALTAEYKAAQQQVVALEQQLRGTQKEVDDARAALEGAIAEAAAAGS